MKRVFSSRWQSWFTARSSHDWLMRQHLDIRPRNFQIIHFGHCCFQWIPTQISEWQINIPAHTDRIFVCALSGCSNLCADTATRRWTIRRIGTGGVRIRSIGSYRFVSRSRRSSDAHNEYSLQRQDGMLCAPPFRTLCTQITCVQLQLRAAGQTPCRHEQNKCARG